MTGQRVLAIDFDATLNSYTGWQGSDNLPEPLPGARDFLAAASSPIHNFRIVISTCRDTAQVRRWLEQYDLNQFVAHVTNQKPIAFAYLDDRSIPFKGTYDGLLEELEAFQPYWAKSLPQL